ncbi:MAG TPA: Ig-like domain-containing protein, partial [Solirubrobacterales bacterium]
MYAKQTDSSSRTASTPLGLRSLLLALALACVALCSSVATASANLIVAPNGNPNATCGENDPCTLRVAVGKVQSGESIFMRPGTYTSLNGSIPATQPAGEALLNLPPGVLLEGNVADPGATVIEVTNPETLFVINATTNDVVRGFVISTNGAGGILLNNARASGLIVTANKQGSVGCQLSSRPPVEALDDTVCGSRGADGAGLRISDPSLVQGSVALTRLSGVTARATGPRSVGIELSFAGATDSARNNSKFTLDVLSTIAEGVAKDIRVNARRRADRGGANEGAEVTVNLRNSSYLTTETIVQPNTGSKATITPVGSGTNLAAHAIFADFFHQASGSPTQARGAKDPNFSSFFDIDGQDRTIGAEPDIGADELGAATQAALNCEAALLRVGAPARCTLDVTNDGGPVLIRGNARFSAIGDSAAFSDPNCALQTVRRGLSRCSLLITPRGVGEIGMRITYKITTAEAPNNLLEAFLQARQGHSTEAKVTCPGTAGIGGAAVCRATVTDLDSSPTLPVGRVRFSSQIAGAPAPGFFRFDSCDLREETSSRASCEVRYTATERGDAPHTIRVSYPGVGLNQPAVGSTDLNVQGELGNPTAITQTVVACTGSGDVRIGNPLDCTATVTDPAAAPSVPRGSLEFHGDAQSFLSTDRCVLQGGAGGVVSCAFTFVPRVEGEQALFATYDGDGTHVPSQGKVPLQVAPELPERFVSETTLNCNAQSAAVRQTVHCIVRVFDPSFAFSPPVGIAKIGTDGAALAPIATQCEPISAAGGGSACEFDYKPRKAGSGPHTLTATYLGMDFGPAENFVPSQAKTQLTVTGATDAQLSCDPTELLIDTPTTCVATAADTLGGPAPLGRMTFRASLLGDFPLGASCLLQPVEPSKSRCQVQFIPRQRGEGDFIADYEGDEEHDGAEFLRAPLQVTGAPSTTELTCTPPSRNFGQATTCVATVTSSRGARPDGSVRITSDSLGTFNPDSCILNPVAGANDKASCAIVYTPTRRDSGTHTLSAAFSGDNTLEPSDAAFPVTVLGVTTKTTVRCVGSSVKTDEISVCSILVADQGTGTRTNPTDTVELTSDSAGLFAPGNRCQLAPAPGNTEESSCDIRYTPTKRNNGTHRLTGAYLGDPDHERSQGVFELAVSQNPTQTALACEPESVALGAASTCTVTVTDTVEPKLALSGQVRFQSDRNGSFSASPANCSLVETELGKASCEIVYTPAAGSNGEHAIAANYGGDEVHDSSQTTDLVVLQSATSTRITGCTPLDAEDPVVEANRAARCSVVVRDLSASPSAPGGEVKFESNSPGTFGDPTNGCVLQPAGPESPDLATCVVGYTPGAAGVHRLTGTYNTDRTHASSSGSFDLAVVARAAVNVTIGCDPAAPRLNQPATCTATVEGGTAPPRGNVLLSSDKTPAFTPAAECALAQVAGAPNRSSCQVTYTPQELGRHLLQGHYGGDVAHLPGDGSVSFEVLRRLTTTDLQCQANVTTGDPALCTVTVTDNGAGKLSLAGDSVNFTVDPTGKGAFDSNPASCTLAEQGGQIGTGTCQITYTPNETLDGAIHKVTASYGATAVHEASSDDAEINVNVPGGGEEPKHVTQTSVSCTPDGVGVGEDTLCLATVIDLDPTPSTPSGNVAFASDRAGQFSSGGCGPVSADRFACTVRFTPSATGDHHITATYGGDARHEAGQPGTTTLPVIAERRPTAAAAVCTPATVIDGSTTTCAITVTDLSGDPTAPTGVVEFETERSGAFPGGNVCGLVPTGEDSASSSCDVVYAPTTGEIGIHGIFANYGVGDATHKPTDTSTQINVITVAEGQKNPTTTTLTCDPTEVQTKTPTTCVATVTDNGDPQRPLTGRIELEASPAGVFNDTSCDTAGAVGTATCEVTFSPDVVGPHTLKATFVGDDAHLSSSGDTQIFAFAANEVRNETSTELSCDPDEVTLGTTTTAFTTCIATVTDDGDPDRPFSGRIEFRSDPEGTFSTTSCDTAGLGTATCVVTFSPQVVGEHLVAATFVGDANHLSSNDEVDIDVVADDGGGEGGEDGTNPTTTDLVCVPGTVATGNQAQCSVTVTDNADTKKSLAGDIVDFTVNPTGKGQFDVNPARCVLTEDIVGTATCAITYIPQETADAIHKISANYAATQTHDASSKDFDLNVTVEGDDENPGGGTNP